MSDEDYDATLELRDDGLEMPEFLKGYVGSFTLRTADVTGQIQTTEHGLPESDYYDGVIAAYPDDDGDYNADLRAGLLALSTPQAGETVYRILDKRTDADQEVETV